MDRRDDRRDAGRGRKARRARTEKDDSEGEVQQSLHAGR